MSKASTKPTPSVIYKLDYPMEYGEELIEKIEFKRLKLKHVKGLGREVSVETLMKLAGKSSGRPPSFFDELDASDGMAIGEIMGSFLENSQTTGKTV